MTICPPFFNLSAGRLPQEIDAIREQLSDEPLQGGEAAVAPYGQRARVTPDRLAFVIREQWKTFNQVSRCKLREKIDCRQLREARYLPLWEL